MTYPAEPSSPTPRWVWWVALAVALAGHLLALYLPGDPEPGRWEVPGLDKAVHLALFCIPAYLARRLTGSAWPMAVLLAHAPVSEVVQWGLVPYRSGDVLDLVADVAGVALGWWWAGRAESGHGRAT
ncbi:MAG: VanZ family protein [Propionibacteriaceae bacterium]|nr:VanZ family protein [Propionibacteriaceae bacterium]